MDAPPPHPYQLPSPLLPTRSSSKRISQIKPGTASTNNSSMKVSRAASSASSRSRKQSKSPKKKMEHPFSAPPTWRSKFGNSNLLRRSKLNINNIVTSAAVDSKRCSTASSQSSRSAHSHLSQRSDFSYSPDGVEVGQAEIVPIVLAPPPRLVDAASPRSEPKTPKATSQGRKLLEYWGVRQCDREVVAWQRASSSQGGGRRSAFKEDFDRVSTSSSGGGGIDGEKASRPRPWEEGVKREGVVLSEGLMKWFRCDIFPSDAQHFHAAEAEAKRLVVEGGGKVMEEWTYLGGFMFQIPRNIASPLPPTVTSATPFPKQAVLSSNLGENGSLRVTEFQPHLQPMEHLLQLEAVPFPRPTSQDTTVIGSPSDYVTEEDDSEMVSAIEYITESLASDIEEIPLLRHTPEKKANSKPQFRQSWSTSTSLSPDSKTKLHAWIGKQQGTVTAKKRREGQIYGLSGPRARASSGLRRIEEVVEVEEVELEGEEEGEWVSDDGDGSDAESEFSVKTGLESVRFVAQCGSLFGVVGE